MLHSSLVGAPPTSTIANPAVTDNLVVRDLDGGAQPGNTLVEGVDYSVVLSTGVITWLATTPADGDGFADYEHFDTPASPAHGTLLVSASATDINGKAVSLVRYDDDASLAGQFDRIDATEV